jgi:hypothetical protein
MFTNMRAANKYTIALFSAFLFVLVASATTNAQTFGGGNTTSLYGASNGSYFQSPGAINQSGTNTQSGGGIDLLQTTTTTGLMVIGSPASIASQTQSDMSVENDEVMLFSIVASLVALSTLFVLWRMLKNSY